MINQIEISYLKTVIAIIYLISLSIKIDELVISLRIWFSYDFSKYMYMACLYEHINSDGPKKLQAFYHQCNP